MSERKSPVSVLGLGNMGSAVAAVFLAGGHPVTVWNRTPAKAALLAEGGARVAASVAEAVAASPLVVTVLLDHHAVRERLAPVAGQLRGRTLLNISSSTPAEIVELAGWAEGAGAHYLDGAMMAVPQAVGTADAQVLYSGAPAAFERHGAQLEVLGAARYLGANPGLAQLHSLGLLSAGYGALSGFLHGAALLDSAAVRPTDFLSLAVPWLNGIVAFLAEVAREAETGDYTAGTASLEVNRLAMEAIEAVSRDAGVHAGVHLPVLDLIRQRIAAAGGTESATSVFEVMRTRS